MNTGLYRYMCMYTVFRLYMDKILPESSKKPYFIYVYSDFCMRCMQVDRIFDKIVNDMENIGMFEKLKQHLSLHLTNLYIIMKWKVDS